MLEIAVHITQVLLALGAAGAVYRVYKGPSVLDRVISLDVMLIIVASMMIVDMVVNDHQDFILFVVVTAVIGFLGAVAIARYVVVRSPEEVAEETAAQDPFPEPPTSPVLLGVPGENEPEAPHDPVSTPAMPGIDDEEDESTSWFSALTRSGFTPRPLDENDAAEEEAVDSDPAESDSTAPDSTAPDSTAADPTAPKKEEDRDV